jgi:hypothetical protein
LLKLTTTTRTATPWRSEAVIGPGDVVPQEEAVEPGILRLDGQPDIPAAWQRGPPGLLYVVRRRSSLPVPTIALVTPGWLSVTRRMIKARARK